MSGSENGENMDRTIVIGHIALIQRSKKQAFVLEVIKALRDKGHDAVGIFAGECRELEYLTELRQKIKEIGLSNQVAFLGRRNDIPDLFKLIDVLMIPSAFEGFPLAGLEAAAAGVPVAACNVAGAKEFIDVSSGGKAFAEDNVSEAVEAVLGCFNDQTLVVKGRRFVVQAQREVYQERIMACFREIE